MKERGWGIPFQGSQIAAAWDHLYGFLVILSLGFFFAIVGAMVYFLIAYRYRHPGQKTHPFRDHPTLEKIFVIFPTLLVLFIFGWGYSLYQKMIHVPSNAYEIRVIGKQWLWQFLYEDGRMTTNEVFVPLGKPVQFVMTSEDVLHSFFVPNFRIKQDVVPGIYTRVSFEATVPGQHVAFCTEFCGTAHSQMIARVVVLEDAEWKNWLYRQEIQKGPLLTYEGEAPLKEGAESLSQGEVPVLTSLIDEGKRLHQTKGCVACHSIDGAKGIGPTFQGLFGKQVELANGKKVTADENYLKQHIEDPRAWLVKGYDPVMPTFKGLITAAEIEALVSYIKSLK